MTVLVEHVRNFPKKESSGRQGLLVTTYFGQKYIHIRAHRPYVLGNPFISRSESDREETISQFREYIVKLLKGNPTHTISRFVRSIIQSHRNGAIIVLYCFCKPLSCHCDVLKEIIERGVE